jgi:putative phosphoesterase
MLALLSDIHGNLAALEAVLADAQARGCTRYLSLGDVVGYYCHPGECIERLQQLGAPNIMGNHDGYVLEDAACPRSKVVAAIIAQHRAMLTPEQRAWLAQSLESLREGTTLYVHGGPRDPREQYLYTVSEQTLPDGVDRLFSGHTHVQVLARFGARAYCNPGSVGQPRDGDPRAAYATVDGDTIALHRVAYDIDRTAAAMRAAGYDPFHYENLYLGAQIGGRVDRVRIIPEESA